MVAVRPVPAGIESGEFRGLLFLAGLPEARSAVLRQVVLEGILVVGDDVVLNCAGVTMFHHALLGWAGETRNFKNEANCNIKFL